MFEKLVLEDILDDLQSRFIINIPEEEYSSIERICFQIEQAHWFYEDFVREVNPQLPSFSLRNFSSLIFSHCPLLNTWKGNSDKAFEHFLEYKIRVPVYGAIILNEKLDKVLLVRGWKASAGWSFPKGKINKDESESNCAVREVFEEIGFDISPFVKENEYVERTMKDQKIRLYIVHGVREDTKFQTQTRKEIGDIKWFPLTSLPSWSNDTTQQVNKNKFYLVTSFVSSLKRWITKYRKRGSSKKKGGITVSSGYRSATDMEYESDFDSSKFASVPGDPVDLDTASQSLKDLLKVGQQASVPLVSGALADHRSMQAHHHQQQQAGVFVPHVPMVYGQPMTMPIPVIAQPSPPSHHLVGFHHQPQMGPYAPQPAPVQVPSAAGSSEPPLNYESLRQAVTNLEKMTEYGRTILNTAESVVRQPSLNQSSYILSPSESQLPPPSLIRSESSRKELLSLLVGPSPNSSQPIARVAEERPRLPDMKQLRRPYGNHSNTSKTDLVSLLAGAVGTKKGDNKDQLMNSLLMSTSSVGVSSRVPSSVNVLLGKSSSAPSSSNSDNIPDDLEDTVVVRSPREAASVEYVKRKAKARKNNLQVSTPTSTDDRAVQTASIHEMRPSSHQSSAFARKIVSAPPEDIEIGIERILTEAKQRKTKKKEQPKSKPTVRKILKRYEVDEQPEDSDNPLLNFEFDTEKIMKEFMGGSN